MNRYLVIIHFREPTYERHLKGNVVRLHPLKASYEVITDCPERAEQLALREFNRTAVQSSVGWVRQVVQVVCKPIGDDVVCQVMGEA